MQISKFHVSFSSNVQKHTVCGFDACRSRAQVFSPHPSGQHQLRLLPVWLGEGLGQSLCTGACRKQWLAEESVNHGGLLQCGVEQQCKD